MTKNYDTITKFEQALAEFTAAPYAVATDCCSHAIELCFRILSIQKCSLPAHTYLSVPMTLKILQVDFQFHYDDWLGEYNFLNTPVWDSARLLAPKMYRSSQYQCISFGPGKPLDNTRGGAILLDNYEQYKKLKKMCCDGRDLSIVPWQNQKKFYIGYHYMMRIEEAESANLKLEKYIQSKNFLPVQKNYPDCSKLIIC